MEKKWDWKKISLKKTVQVIKFEHGRKEKYGGSNAITRNKPEIMSENQNLNREKTRKIWIQVWKENLAKKEDNTLEKIKRWRKAVTIMKKVAEK